MSVETYTVYKGHSDRVGPYTVRCWMITPGGQLVPKMAFDFKSLESARESIPAGLIRVAPHPCDDPVIVETWL